MWDAQENKFTPITEAAAKAAPISTIIFKRGEVVELKGLRFEVKDIAPKQLKIRLLGAV